MLKLRLKDFKYTSYFVFLDPNFCFHKNSKRDIFYLEIFGQSN